jgi:hypothetical protein
LAYGSKTGGVIGFYVVKVLGKRVFSRYQGKLSQRTFRPTPKNTITMRFLVATLAVLALTAVSASGQTIKLISVTPASIKANDKNGPADDGVRTLTITLHLFKSREGKQDKLLILPTSAISKPILLDSVVDLDRSQFPGKSKQSFIVSFPIRVKLSPLACLPKDEQFAIARKDFIGDSAVITIEKFNVPAGKPTIALKEDSTVLDLAGNKDVGEHGITMTLMLAGERPEKDMPVEFSTPSFMHFTSEPAIVDDVNLVIPKNAFDSIGCPVDIKIPTIIQLKAPKNPGNERIPIVLNGDEKHAHTVIVYRDAKADALDAKKALAAGGLSFTCVNRSFLYTVKFSDTTTIYLTDAKTGRKASYDFTDVFHSGDFAAWFGNAFPLPKRDTCARCGVCGAYLAERIMEHLAAQPAKKGGDDSANKGGDEAMKNGGDAGTKKVADSTTKSDSTTKAVDSTAKAKSGLDISDVKKALASIINGDSANKTKIGTIYLKDSMIDIHTPTMKIRSKIESVTFTIESGRIAKKFLFVDTKDGRFFNGSAPISVSHINDRGNDILVSVDPSQNHTYVQLKDVMIYKPVQDYLPDDAQNLSITPQQPTCDLSAASNLNSLINFSIFTDLPGLLGRRANGLINASASGRFITNTKNAPNSDFIWFSFIDANVTVSKFDSKFKSLDSTNIRVDPINHLDTLDRLQLEQNAWLRGSVKFNVASLKLLSSQSVEVNVGAIFNVTNADSIYKKDHDIVFADYYPEAVYSIKRLNNFGMDLTVRWMFQFISDKEKFSSLHGKEIFNPQVAFYYYPANNSNSQMYLRFNYFAGHAKNDNNFYQLQVGYKTSLKL